EGFRLFAEARRTDPEVAWGYLLEAMVWLSYYLRSQALPKLTEDSRGLWVLGEIVETEKMKESRKKFEKLLAAARSIRVWGEEAASDFEEVLSGFRKMQEKDHAGALKGLDRAFALSELSWVETEIRLARNQVRFCQGDFAVAAEEIERAAGRFPEHSLFWHRLGICRYGEALQLQARGSDSRELLQKAIECYDKGLRVAPDSPVMLDDRGNAQYNLAILQQRMGGDWEAGFKRAVEDLSEAVRLDPSTLGHSTNLGNAYLSHGIALEESYGDPRAKYRQAVETYTRVLDKDPGDALARTNRASARFKLGRAGVHRGIYASGDLARAAEDYERVLKDAPRSFRALRGLGETLYYLARVRTRRGGDARDLFRRAIGNLDKALEIEEDAGALIARGSTRKELGDAEWAQGVDPIPHYRKALADYAEGLRVRPGSHAAVTNTGIAWMAIGIALHKRGQGRLDEFEKAREAFESVLKEHPNDFVANFNAGKLYNILADLTQRGGEDPGPNLRKSVECFKTARRVNPSVWESLVNLGLLYERLGRYEEAVDSYETALAVIKDGYPPLKNLLARARSKLDTPKKLKKK
ncbi:MAG: tetratricopeptide repeat protein, partial [Planctomycetota bacterium]